MYKIKVKQYMTKKSTPSFDFMKKWNNDEPMPLRVMVGDIIQQTPGMVKMELHADITEKVTPTCMKCGRPITNPVSQFFGMGPECGSHNYVNPFDSEEELKEAVENYRLQLRNIKWTGWVIKSAIEEMTDLDNRPVELEKTESKKEVVNKKMKATVSDSKKMFEDKALFLEFQYDNKAVATIRELSNKYWHSEDKLWEVPCDALDILKRKLTDFDIELIGELPKKEKAKSIEVADFEFKTTPFEHQIEGFNYGLSKDRWLLGDEQGLGKTKQVIDIAVARKVARKKENSHCLIICGVNGLKWNWANEVKTHSNESAWILGQRTTKAGKIKISSSKDKLEDLIYLTENPNYFIITNIESLRDTAIVERISTLCKKGVIDLVAVDECHKAKNPTSQQGKGLLKISANNMIAMSGTPLMNTPMDLYIIMKWLGYEKHSFYAFKQHYCVMGGFGGYEVVGYKHLDELQNNLNSIMLRRLKSDVLDLPEKLFINEFVELTAKQSTIYKEVSAEIKNNIDAIECSNNPLAELIRLRQATGYTGILSTTIQESAKLDRLEELVEEHTDNGQKVVIFSNWTQMTKPAYDRLRKYRPIVITGETKDNERQFFVKQFQEDKNTKVAIGTIGAMGTGLTLTAGTVVIFLDEPWTMAAKEQAIDRCHRIGTTQNITVYTLMAKDTIDERIHQLVEDKGAMSSALVDGKYKGNKAELLNFLLS